MAGAWHCRQAPCQATRAGIVLDATNLNRVPPRPGFFLYRRTTTDGAAAQHPRIAHRAGDQLMYVAVKGGEQAIDNAHALLAERRRGDPSIPELSVEQLQQQMPLAVSRIMSEGSLYDPQLAALALKQAT